MAKYIVDFTQKAIASRIIEADSPKQAMELAKEALNDDYFLAGLSVEWHEDEWLDSNDGVEVDIDSEYYGDDDTDWPE